MNLLQDNLVIAECTECGNEAEAWIDDNSPMCEYCQHAEICEPPKNITFGSAQWSGEGRAYCKKCDYVSGYWECGCDLEHNCEGK